MLSHLGSTQSYSQRTCRDLSGHPVVKTTFHCRGVPDQGTKILPPKKNLQLLGETGRKFTHIQWNCRLALLMFTWLMAMTISDKTSRARIYLPDNGHNHKTLQQVNIHVSTGLFGKNEKFAWRGEDGGQSLSRLISASSSRVPTPTAKTGRLRMPVPRLPGSLGSRILWVPPMRWLHTRCMWSWVSGKRGRGVGWSGW